MNRRVPRLDLVQKIVEQAAKGNGGRFPIALHALGAGPYSLAAVGAWLVIEMGFRRAGLGRAIALGIASHLIRDRLTHDCEIVLWPGLQSPEQSTGPQATARP